MKTLYMYIIFTLLLCISTITVFAEDFYGKIAKDEISEATVILIELDLIEVSDAEGNFAFYGVEPGEYTLKVITSEEEMDFSITVGKGQDNSKTPEIFEIIKTPVADGVVEEEITITAERDIQQEPNITDYSAELVENIPFEHKDPFNIIANEAGVQAEQRDSPTLFLSNIDPSQLSGDFFTSGAGYSVYGGDSSWNQSYLDFLLIPVNVHMTDNSKSIITKESISTIRTIKGPPPGRYGQALGGTVIVYPKEVTNNRLDLGLSITDPFIGYRTKIGKNVKLFTFVRHSLSQYTVLPILKTIAESNDKSSKTNLKNYLYGDWLFSLNYDAGDDILKVLSLVYYDKVHITAKTNTKKIKNDFLVNNFPYFFGGGVQWRRVVAQQGLNVLDVTSYYSVASLDNNFIYERCYKLKDDECSAIKIQKRNYAGNSKAWTIGLKEVFSWAFTNAHLLSFGTSLEYSDLYANYEDRYFKQEDEEEKEHTLPKYTIDETIFRTYAYTQYDYEDYFDKGNIKFSLSPGISWILEKPTSVYPSARGEFATTFGDIHTVSLSAGWSPAFLEKMQYMDKKILEKTIEYRKGETKYTDPNYGLMLSTQYLIALGNHQLSINPYFGWYYNFNGLFSQFQHKDTSTNRGYSYKLVNKGFGTGATLRWKYTIDKHALNISYNAGFVYFHTKDDKWVPTADDIRHTIQLSYLWNVHKAFNFSLVHSIKFDKPFTPTKMVHDTSSKELIEENGDLNSARSYLPELSLIPYFTGDFVDKKLLKFSYRFALGNLLAFINYKDGGLKDKSYEGASNKDMSNRKIDDNYDNGIGDWINTMEITLYLTFKL